MGGFRPNRLMKEQGTMETFPSQPFIAKICLSPKLAVSLGPRYRNLHILPLSLGKGEILSSNKTLISLAKRPSASSNESFWN